MSGSGTTPGRVPWRLWVPDPSRLSIPADLAARLDAGEAILAAGRASGHGTKARDSSARDLAANIALLRKRTGIDFTGVLPSHARLVAALEQAPTEVRERDDGEELTHRFVLLDLKAEAGLVCLLATGSGSRLTKDWEQPYVARAAREYREHRAALFACKRLDRGGRHDWGLAPLMLAVRHTDGWICDEDRFGPFDEAASFGAFFKGSSARKQASDMPLQTRREQKNRSGSEMVEGQARYHAAPPVPPGFGVCWLRGSGTAPRVRLAYLDTDACRPPEEAIAYGQSDVRHPDGHPLAGAIVDQVENVRFVLRTLATPGWSQVRIMNELVARRYSTDKLRADNGAAASVTDPERTDYLRAIVEHLDLYETGVLTIGVGAGVEPVVISGCLPPDGPWASPEDFARIRQARSEHMHRAVYRRLTFSGLKASLDGVPVRMVFDSHTFRRHAISEYKFVLEEQYPRQGVAPDANRRLAPLVFAESLVEALASADDVPLGTFLPDEGAPDPALADLRARCHLARANLEALQERRRALLQRIEATDDGMPLLQGALFREVQETYNTLVERDIPSAEAELKRCSTRLAEADSKRRRPTTSNKVLRLVESLRDPSDLAYQELWLSSLHGFQFTTGVETRRGRQVKTLAWKGEIVIREGEAEYSLPVSGAFEYPSRGRRVAETRRDLAAASVVVTSAGASHAASQCDVAQARSLLAEVTGLHTRHYLLTGCDDPRILQVATAALGSPDIDDEAIAAQLHEPAALVTRIRALHGSKAARGPWRKDWSRAHAAFYVLGAQGGAFSPSAVAAAAGTSVGQVYNVAQELRRLDTRWSSRRKNGYTYTPCACGSTSSLLLTIPEPHGAVCRTCRRDQASVVWPADPYDRFIAHPDLMAPPVYGSATR